MLKPAVAAATGGGATPATGADAAAAGDTVGAGAAACATLFAVTRQLWPFSKPKPSLSESDVLLRHSGNPLLPEVPLEEALTDGIFC